MATTEKELEKQLLETGHRLENPPASVDELLQLLDEVEIFLSRVDQSPAKSVQSALDLSLKALVRDQLFRHPNVDVKVAVASCISEITRITAPDAPYDDDQMKDIFQLIVSSFENLADNSSRSYGKRTLILETVAKVRSCVVMLDLECDALIVEMFRHFLNAIRDYHPENIFTSMETIMILVIEESEDISPELLSPLLDSVKRGNEEDLLVTRKLGEKVLESCTSKEALPVARKLGEKVLESCASKVKPYLVHAVKSLGLSLDDYSDVVATICQDMSVTDEQNDVHTAVDNKVDKNKIAGGGLLDEAAQADEEMAVEAALPKLADLLDDNSLKLVVSNGVAQTAEHESFPTITPKEQADDKLAEQSGSIDKSNSAVENNLVAEKGVGAESTRQKSAKKRGRTADSAAKLMKPSGSSNADLKKVINKPSKDENHGSEGPSFPNGEPLLEVAVSSEQKESDNQVSLPKASEGDAITVASPIVSEGLPDESLSKKASRLKERLIKDSALPADDASKKASEVTDSDAKLQKHLVGDALTGIAVEDHKQTMADAKGQNDTTSESEEKSLKQPSKKVDISRNGDGSSLKQLDDKKSRSRGKAILENNVSKNSSQYDDKEKISSLRSATKAAKDEQRSEVAPKTDAKRKHDSGKEIVSDDVESNEGLVGSKIKVWWPLDDRFYKGVIDSYDRNKKKHKVLYNDGDMEMLILKKEIWKFVDSGAESDEEEVADSPRPDALPEDVSPEMPLKKMKISDQSTRQEKPDSSTKSGGPSSSKSYSAGTKSGRKSKEDDETDGKPRKHSKSVRKTEDNDVRKNEELTVKGGSKSTSASSKSSGKSKNDDGVSSKTGKVKDDECRTPKTSKSKQDTPKTGKSKQATASVMFNAKEKAPKNGGKSNANGTGKSTSGSSKVGGTEGKESKSVSVKTQESTKRKLASSTKGQGSEGKNEKKRLKGA